MSKRDELIATYADDLDKKCGVKADMDLLRKVTLGLGPSIYRADSCTVAGTDPKEMERIKTNFLEGKLGLPDGPELMDAIEKVIDTYGRSERRKHRAVVYYLLAEHFGKQDVYG